MSATDDLLAQCQAIEPSVRFERHPLDDGSVLLRVTVTALAKPYVWQVQTSDPRETQDNEAIRLLRLCLAVLQPEPVTTGSQPRTRPADGQSAASASESSAHVDRSATPGTRR